MISDWCVFTTKPIPIQLFLCPSYEFIDKCYTIIDIMRSDYSDSIWESNRATWLQLLSNYFPILLFLGLALGGMLAVHWYFSPITADASSVAAAQASGNLSAPIYKDVPSRPVTQRLAQSPGPIRVGIIAGHSGHDSGAVCDDGLTEAEVNETIANKVIADLEAQGVRVDLLQEFDEQLQNYSATAVISIHADSCTYYNEQATGFKIAGSGRTDSSALSICIEDEYRKATELPYHANTITPHMTDYHAFRAIAPGTPAIIIEVGFLNLDRELLTTQADIPAGGITKGILCYLDQVR